MFLIVQDCEGTGGRGTNRCARPARAHGTGGEGHERRSPREPRQPLSCNPIKIMSVSLSMTSFIFRHSADEIRITNSPSYYPMFLTVNHACSKIKKSSSRP